jgi:outer membrane lipoprotein carrier protein
MVFLLLFCLLGQQTSADSRAARGIARAVETRYRHAATLKAVFFQRYADGNGGTAAESGVVYFSRPGRMRWEYESPEQKLFLVDGTNVWLYVPADRTASRAKMKQSSDWRTPIALLAGKADLGQLCRKLEVVNAADSGGKASGTADERAVPQGDTVLRCKPRGESAEGDPIREVLLETNEEAFLVRVLIRETGNVETEFRFGAWEENIPIPEAKFHFEVPPGVTIVDEASLADALH